MPYSCTHACATITFGVGAGLCEGGVCARDSRRLGGLDERSRGAAGGDARFGVGHGAQADRGRDRRARALSRCAADRARAGVWRWRCCAITACSSCSSPRSSGCPGIACTPRPRCSSTCSPRSSRQLIAARLGDPAVDPHGDPIPTPEFEIDERPTRSLDELPVGAAGRFVRVSDSDPEMLRYLAEHGITLGRSPRGRRSPAVRWAGVRALRRARASDRRRARPRDADRDRRKDER